MAPEQPDLGELIRQAQMMQEQLQNAQEEAASQVVEGHSGSGAVKVRVTGTMEFRSVSIDPAVVDTDDITMLEDLVLAAINDAVRQAGELTESALGSTQLGGIDLGGLDLGALGLGGSGPGIPGLGGATGGGRGQTGPDTQP